MSLKKMQNFAKCLQINKKIANFYKLMPKLHNILEKVVNIQLFCQIII